MPWRFFVFTSSTECFGCNLVWSSSLLKRCSKWMLFKALESSSVFTMRAYSKPTSAWQSGAYTHFSWFPIVIYRQFVQIGKWAPPKRWILFNWVFKFVAAVGFGSSPLLKDFLATWYILSPVKSLKKRCCHTLFLSSALSWIGQWSQLDVMGSILELQKRTRLS